MSEIIVPQIDVTCSTDFGFVFHPPTGGLTLLLEQVAASYCISHGRPLLKATNHYTKKAVFWRPRCKQWNCPSCGTINAKNVVRVALFGSQAISKSGLPLSFVTNTSHEKLSPRATLKVLPLAWPKLRKRIAREYGNPEWLVIPEQHSDGRLHLHGIFGADIEKRWLKDNARACGFGYQADATPVDSIGQVAAYTAGYMSKTLMFSNWARGFRRFRTSGGWSRPARMTLPDGWNLTTLPGDAVQQNEVDRLMELNYVVAVGEATTAYRFMNEVI